MSLFRLVNEQKNSDQEIMITELEHGLPNKPFGIYHQQPMYVPFNHKYRDSQGIPVQDTDWKGNADYMASDAFINSNNNGQISKLSSNSFLKVVSYQEGDTDAPSISSIKHDTNNTTEEYEIDVTITDGNSGQTGDYEITVNNVNINGQTESFTDPDGSADESSNIASNLATQINNNNTLSSEVTASASGSTVNITTDKDAIPFTVSTNTTDGGGSISQSTVATGRVIITGSRLTSVDPFESEFTLTDDSAGDSNTFTATEVSNASNGLVSQSVVVVPDGLHGMGASTGDVESVSVQTQDPNQNKTASDGSMSQV